MSEPAGQVPAGPQDQSEYSLAFKTFVNGSDDLPGLLAYALYKQAIGEAVRSGRPVPQGKHRCPTLTEVSAYRGAADQWLTSFAGGAVDEARPEIIEQSIGAIVATATAEMKEHISSRTSMRTAIAANIVAWLVTLAATIIIVSAFYLPNWQAATIEGLRDILATQPAAPAPPN